MVATLDPQDSGAADRRWPRRLFGSRSLRVLAVRGLGMAALFGFEIVVARSLGVGGYGVFSVALAVAIVVSRLASLGWLNASTRLVSDYVSSARYGLLRASLLQAHGTTALGLLMAALLLALFSWGWGTSPFISLGPVLLIASALAFLELHRHVLRGLHAGDLGEALLVLLLPAFAMAAIWMLGISEPGGALYAYAALCAALLLLSTVVIARRLPTATWKVPANFRSQAWTLAALAMLLGSASDELTARLAVIVLGALGDEAEAGLYQAAARLALLNVFVLRALTPVAAPRIAVLYANGQLAELRAAFRRLCLFSLAGSLPIFLILVAAPGRVLALFGAEFTEADDILRVLSVGYLASAAAGPCATALMMIGRERIYGVLAFSTLLLNIGATVLLARHFGGVGAALATAGIIVLNNALYVWIFCRATAPRSLAAASPET